MEHTVENIIDHFNREFKDDFKPGSSKEDSAIAAIYFLNGYTGRDDTDLAKFIRAICKTMEEAKERDRP